MNKTDVSCDPVDWTRLQLKVNNAAIAYLIGKDTRQVKHHCYGNSRLMLISKAFHDIFLRHFAFLCWRRLPHEGRRIRRETERVHLREIDSCVLTWAAENDYSEQVGQLDSGFNWRRNAMVTFTFPDWIPVVMEIKNPRLQFWILSKTIISIQNRNHGLITKIDEYFGYLYI